MSDAMILAHQKRPDLFGLDEERLMEVLALEKRAPTATDNYLRMRFWIEYEKAHAEGRKMQLSAVYTGVCHRAYFYSRYLERPENVAWMLTPAKDYEDSLSEALLFSTNQIREILSTPHKTPEGKYDLKLMELKVKIHKMIEDRKLGGVTQRTEQRNMNLNVSGIASPAQLQKLTEQNSMEDLDRRLKELRKRDRLAVQPPEGETNGTEA